MSIEQRLRDGLAENARSIDPFVERELGAVLARKRRRTHLRWAGYGGMAAAAAVVTVVALALIGQRQATTPPATPDTTTTTSTTTTNGLAGRYVVDVAASKQAEHLNLVGRWVIVLEDDGALELVPPVGYTGIVSGLSYRIEGDRIRTNAFIDSPGCQRTADQSGLYEWHQSGGVVDFVVAHDDCAARRLIFSGQTWVSAP